MSTGLGFAGSAHICYIRSAGTCGDCMHSSLSRTNQRFFLYVIPTIPATCTIQSLLATSGNFSPGRSQSGFTQERAAAGRPLLTGSDGSHRRRLASLAESLVDVSPIRRCVLPHSSGRGRTELKWTNAIH